MSEFKLIVAGGRDFNDYTLLSDSIFYLAHNIYADNEVSFVSGMANGADNLGYSFAVSHNVKRYMFPADWSLGKSAGFIRNKQMGDFSDGLLAFHDGTSRGTKHMIDYMRSINKQVHIVNY